MKLKFFKMQANGNDYIYFDSDFCDVSFVLNNAEDLSKSLSIRRFSVGSDGICIIDKSEICDAKMIIYNSDGTRAKNCGNALRSVGYYLSNKINKNIVTVETDSGINVVTIKKSLVTVNMGKPKFLPYHANQVYDKEKCEYLFDSVFYKFVNVGNNHLVILREKSCDNGLIAPLLTECERIFDGINVEVVTINNGINVTVYERGSGETFCCGTGATAVYYSLINNGVIKKARTPLNFKGGTVFMEEFNGDVYLSGEVKFCYEGVICYDKS